MRIHSTSLLLAAAATLAIAGAAPAQNLKQVGTISIPGVAINQFAGMAIDQETGLGYLADKDNKGVAVFDTATGKFVSRFEGFVGLTKDGNMSGPNGVMVAGGELWVSDGDSTIKVIDLKSGKLAGTIATGGKSRSNGMAFDPKNQIVIVANSNDDPPFFAFVSTAAGHKVTARIPIPQSGENLERSSYHAPSGTFFTAIPVLRADPAKGIIAQTDPASGKLVKLHEIERCHPHSLQVVSDTTIFLGCSSAHGASPKPGGDMAIFDIPSGKVTGYGENMGGNGDSTFNAARGLYYHATTNASLKVVDVKTGKLVQDLRTSPGARSLAVHRASNRVYVATNAKDGPCGGCIVVYAPE